MKPLPLVRLALLLLPALRPVDAFAEDPAAEAAPAAPAAPADGAEALPPLAADEGTGYHH